jgi:hypothetical protein
MFSIVMPMDTNRLEQFSRTKAVYDKMPQKKEFLIPTRSLEGVSEYLREHNLMKNVSFIPYEHDTGYNPSKALNLGTKEAKYDQVIITSPEVMPLTDVLSQLESYIGENVVCNVVDQNPDGSNGISLVNKGYRDSSPMMYFLAMFNKADIYAINGWDEEFMRGYAHEDNDFGERWNRAGLPFVVDDDIKAIHQYHPRSETIHNGWQINSDILQENNIKGIIRPMNGIIKL